MAKKMRDCAECADQHDVSRMYSGDNGYICEPCFQDTFSDDDEYKELEI